MGVGKPANVDLEVEGDTLIIRINLNRELGLSRSKKNILVATTSGNIRLGAFGFKEWFLGVNVFREGQRVTPHFRRSEEGDKLGVLPRQRRRTRP